MLRQRVSQGAERALRQRPDMPEEFIRFMLNAIGQGFDEADLTLQTPEGEASRDGDLVQPLTQDHPTKFSQPTEPPEEQVSVLPPLEAAAQDLPTRLDPPCDVLPVDPELTEDFGWEQFLRSSLGQDNPPFS